MVTYRLTPHDFVAAGLYASEAEVVQAALDQLLAGNPDLRVRLAIHRYRSDQELTLATAAALAGVSRWRMIELLEEFGVEPRLGPLTPAEARAEVKTLRQARRARPD